MTNTVQIWTANRFVIIQKTVKKWFIMRHESIATSLPHSRLMRVQTNEYSLQSHSSLPHSCRVWAVRTRLDPALYAKTFFLHMEPSQNFNISVKVFQNFPSKFLKISVNFTNSKSAQMLLTIFQNVFHSSSNFLQNFPHILSNIYFTGHFFQFFQKFFQISRTFLKIS